MRNSDIKHADIRLWQSDLIKEGYAPTYLKTINNKLKAIFNFAVRYYNLNENLLKKVLKIILIGLTIAMLKSTSTKLLNGDVI